MEVATGPFAKPADRSTFCALTVLVELGLFSACDQNHTAYAFVLFTTLHAGAIA
jgi:hypothetical protein